MIEVQRRNRLRIFPTKAIRILSLAPDSEANAATCAPDPDAATAEDERNAIILEIMDTLSDDDEDHE